MPTAFVSYSWDSAAHREWVRRFAADLRSHGVDAWLDQWDVQLGDDVTEFMERGITQADYVLIVCTEPFAAKANGRRSGVGYEQAIVTADLLNSQPPRGRFVCVLRGGTPSLAIPRYMQARLWVDLRADLEYARGLEQLLVHMFRRYDDQKPPLQTQVIAPAVSELPSASTTQPPLRWVLVAGTGIAHKFTEELADVSKYLGGLLATKGLGVVTGGWAGVDEAVARAFSDATTELGVALEDRLVQVVVKSKEPAFAAGQLIFVDEGDEEWTEPIRRADAVVLIGGVGGTRTTGEIALKMGKSVLPLADTGGDAKSVYLQMLKDWDQLGLTMINQSQFQRLARPRRGGVDAALDLISKLGPGAEPQHT